MSPFNECALIVFLLAFIIKYARTVVGCYTFLAYKAKAVAAEPKFTHADATVIIPTTFKAPAELVHCVRNILACNPAFVHIVTSFANVELIQQLCVIHGFTDKVAVHGVEHLNKRDQIIKALGLVTSQITVLADDDVFWPEIPDSKHNYLDLLLAIFEDDAVGAGGTRQRVRRNDKPDIWNILGIAYLERRVWNNCLTNAIDGSISTLSGRTAAYRTEVLQTDEFCYYFKNDMWRGKPLNSDDDKCLTRFVYSHGWKIVLQFDERSTLETTVEGDSKYLSQCMRWARAHWRGNLTVMENETYWCSFKYAWGAYVIYFGSYQTPSILWDAFLWMLLWLSVSNSPMASTIYISFGLWMLASKTVKMIPHFLRHPADIKWLPGLIAFSYFHGLLNVYARLSMSQTQWGSQNLATLEVARAERDEVVPLLQDTIVSSKSVEPVQTKMLTSDQDPVLLGADRFVHDHLIGDGYFDVDDVKKEDVLRQ